MIKLTYVPDYTDSTIREVAVSLRDDVQWSDLMESFRGFLIASGFEVPRGSWMEDDEE